jgi:choice-of-anchor C domain-containing protein
LRTLLRTAAASALAALTIVAAPSAAGAAELLVNGSFEDIGAGAPEGWGGLTYYAGGVALPGWTVASGSVDLTTSASFWGPAYDGNYSLDINGWNPGTITQSFGTVIGQLYAVSFAYGRNVAGAENPATATVTAGGQTVNVSAADDGSFGSGRNMIWKTGGFTFTGTGSPTTISLQATNGSNGGVFFDKISVQSEDLAGAAAVPEPATWALMIGGFGLMGAMLRRRRGLAAT